MASILENGRSHTLAIIRTWSGPATAETSLEFPQKHNHRTTAWYGFMNNVYIPEGLQVNMP